VARSPERVWEEESEGEAEAEPEVGSGVADPAAVAGDATIEVDAAPADEES